MNRNHELNQPIDYDAYKALAHELRRQEIDRLLGEFSAWFAGLWQRRAAAPARHAVAVTPRASQC